MRTKIPTRLTEEELTPRPTYSLFDAGVSQGHRRAKHQILTLLEKELTIEQIYQIINLKP